MAHAIAHNGEVFSIHANGQEWHSSWHPPVITPVGTRHGAAGICMTSSGEVVLISEDGSNWDFPAGRPEGDENWEQTLRREMLEEACATVTEAQLLGFTQNICVAGPETGLVLVRSFWRAEVVLGSWEPQFEICHRRVVAPAEILFYLSPLFLPLSRRALYEAHILM